VNRLLAAWRVSLHRTRADWPIVAAAWLIVLLAATLLSAGPIYSRAVSLAGLHRVLADSPTADANIEIMARVPLAEAPDALQHVGEQIGAASGGLAVDVAASGRSDSYALPGQQPDQVRDLAVLGFLDGVEDHATLLSGAWPTTVAANRPVEIAVAEPIATALNLAIGTDLPLVSRLDPGKALDVVVVGIYRPTDPTDPFWWDDPTLLDGRVESDQYRTFGPMLTTRDDLLGRALGQSVPLTWHAFPRFSDLTIDQIPHLKAGLDGLAGRISATLGGFPIVRTKLTAILTTSERSLLVSGTGILLLMIQLAILAVYAIVLTAALIVDHRRLDTALLRSRGAGPLQIGGLALAEGLLLALPAGIAGPWLAAGALRILNVAGPLAGIGLQIQPTVGSDAYLAAITAAVACAVLLVLPALAAARSFAAEQAGRSRHETRTFGQRLGLDIALLAVTAVGIWQLRLYGAPLTRTVHGTIGLDPLLVAAPAIGLLAGGVVALRLFPLMAQLIEDAVTGGRNLVGSLGARQLARRPLRYTRAALLLMLAMSMGVFAVSYATTWINSQRDQATFQVGADLRVTPASGPDALPSWSLASAYTSEPGISLAMPVERQTGQFPGKNPGELLALDPAVASQIVTIRADLVQAPLASELQPLLDARPAVKAIAVPGRPERLQVTAQLSIDALEGDPRFRPQDPLDVSILVGQPLLATSVYILDARGMAYRFDAQPTPYAPGEQQVVVPLLPSSGKAQEAMAAATAHLEYPIQVIGVELTVSLPSTTIATAGSVGLTAMAASDQPEGAGFEALNLDAGGWEVGMAVGPGSPIGVIPAEGSAGRTIDLANPDVGGLPGIDRDGHGVTVSFVPSAVVGIGSTFLSAVVNEPLLAQTGSQVGDVIDLPLDGESRSARIVGVVGSFPTTDPSRPLAIIDIGALGVVRFQTSSHATRPPTEWWLKADDAAASAFSGRASSGTFARAVVISRAGRTSTLSSDPLALGIIGALTLGFIVAGLFAVIGLAASAAVSARQRRGEFALLRALGLSGGQLSGWLWLENASLVLVSLLAGTGLGLLIGWVVLPFITVTEQAAVPFPPVIVEIPWSTILVLEAITAAALALTVVGLAAVLRRAGVGSVLRMGGE
jgi:FtsX-like permease family